MASFVYQFGDFHLDCGRFELRRAGRALKLERKPLELLILLVASKGQLVTRSEIAERLWGSEVFVDTEHGINTAIRKIRTVLRDDPENPHFVQTVTGMGYRFIAAVVPEAAAADTPPDPPAPAPIQVAPPAAPSRFTSWRVAGGVAILAALTVALTAGPRSVVGRLLHRNAQPAIASLAVLPLDNLSGDPNQEYFAEGMTDELITMLAKDSSLRITSRTSVMQYKGVHRPLPEIARALHVDGILEGSVARTDGQVHMTLQLIRADTDTHIWAESYDRGKDNVAALPDEAARSIALELHSAIASPGPAHSVSPEAHDAYLRGRYFLEKREADKSAAYFQQAISIDPLWSQAYSGLATAVHSEAILSNIPFQEAVTKGEAAARRAIQLDADNGEAYSTLGLIEATLEWNWTDAEQNLKRGIALSPDSADAEQEYAIYLDAVNHPEEAVIHMRKALELDPQSFLMNRHLGSTLYYARRYDEALFHLRQAEEMEPGKTSFIMPWVSEVYEAKGMRDEAVGADLLDIHTFAPASVAPLRALYKRDGWKAYWEARMKTMLSEGDGSCNSYNIGVNYIRLGKSDLAFPHFHRSIDDRCAEAIWMMVDSRLDSIRTDPRYNDLLKRMNLPH